MTVKFQQVLDMFDRNVRLFRQDRSDENFVGLAESMALLRKIDRLGEANEEGKVLPPDVLPQNRRLN